MQPDVIARLRAANPAAVDPDRGHEHVAQAAMQRILDTPPPAPLTARRAVGHRGLVLVFAVLVLGVGGALAATDPMGWWSSNPSEAHYRVNPNLRVRTPTAQQIRCRTSGNGQFLCSPAREVCYQVGQRAPYCKLSGTGLPYMQIDALRAPPSSSVLSRAGFKKGISKALAGRTMTAAQAAKLRADVAAVPDGFFSELQLAWQYGTYGSGGDTRNGHTRVPPVGQPATMVCTTAGRGLSCQDLNGDVNAPIGAGVYSAEPGPGWRWVRSPPYIGGSPPGIRFTRAESRVLFDLVRSATTTSSSSGVTKGQAKPSRVIHLKH